MRYNPDPSTEGFCIWFLSQQSLHSDIIQDAISFPSNNDFSVSIREPTLIKCCLELTSLDQPRQDSLPLRADAIIDKYLIKKSTIVRYLERKFS